MDLTVTASSDSVATTEPADFGAAVYNASVALVGGENAEVAVALTEVSRVPIDAELDTLSYQANRDSLVATATDATCEGFATGMCSVSFTSTARRALLAATLEVSRTYDSQSVPTVPLDTLLSAALSSSGITVDPPERVSLIASLTVTAFGDAVDADLESVFTSTSNVESMIMQMAPALSVTVSGSTVVLPPSPPDAASPALPAVASPPVPPLASSSPSTPIDTSGADVALVTAEEPAAVELSPSVFAPIIATVAALVLLAAILARWWLRLRKKRATDEPPQLTRFTRVGPSAGVRAQQTTAQQMSREVREARERAERELAESSGNMVFPFDYEPQVRHSRTEVSDVTNDELAAVAQLAADALPSPRAWSPSNGRREAGVNEGQLRGSPALASPEGRSSPSRLPPLSHRPVLPALSAQGGLLPPQPSQPAVRQYGSLYDEQAQRTFESTVSAQHIREELYRRRMAARKARDEVGAPTAAASGQAPAGAPATALAGWRARQAERQAVAAPAEEQQDEVQPFTRPQRSAAAMRSDSDESEEEAADDGLRTAPPPAQRNLLADMRVESVSSLNITRVPSVEPGPDAGAPSTTDILAPRPPAQSRGYRPPPRRGGPAYSVSGAPAPSHEGL